MNLVQEDKKIKWMSYQDYLVWKEMERRFWERIPLDFENKGESKYSFDLEFKLKPKDNESGDKGKDN